MRASADTGERVVCAVLAEQVASIRDHVDSDATVELLWKMSDTLASLSSLVLELAHRQPAPDPQLEEKCAAAVASEAEVTRALDALAFLQSQRQDLARQKADCVVTALGRLAVLEQPPDGRLSPEQLAAMYISPEQRDVHDQVTSRFGWPAPAAIAHPDAANDGSAEVGG